MAFLTKRRQIAARLETTLGTAETLTAGDNIPRISNVTWAPTSLQVERNINRNTLTPFPKLVPGQTTIQFTFDVEIGGHTTNSAAETTLVEPNWGKLLRGSAMEKVSSLRTMEGNSAIVGGPFQHGEGMNQAVSGAVGTVVADTYTGAPAIYIEETSGTFNATNEITGSVSGATITPGTLSTATNIAYRLRSDTDSMEGLTMSLYADGKIVKARGCMGTMDFVYQHGNPVKASCTFDGIFVSNADGELLSGTGLQVSQFVPPTFFSGNTVLSLTDASDVYGTGQTGAAGPLNTIGLSLGNSVVMRENSLAASGGLDNAFISERAGVGSFNPDELLNSTYDFISSFTGGTLNRMRLQVGTTHGNRFEWHTPGMLFTGMGDGDRDGVYTLDASFDLTGGDYGSGAAGSDNELVIIVR